jgi:hypothetical protein
LNVHRYAQYTTRKGDSMLAIATVGIATRGIALSMLRTQSSYMTLPGESLAFRLDTIVSSAPSWL